MARVRFRPAAGAARRVARIAKPGLERAADAVAGRLTSHVPVVHGGAVATYDPTVRPLDEGYAVHVGSPLWHLLEYGTAFSPAYRPVEQTVRGLRLRWEAQ